MEGPVTEGDSANPVRICRMVIRIGRKDRIDKIGRMLIRIGRIWQDQAVDDARIGERLFSEESAF